MEKHILNPKWCLTCLQYKCKLAVPLLLHLIRLHKLFLFPQCKLKRASLRIHNTTFKAITLKTIYKLNYIYTQGHIHTQIHT